MERRLVYNGASLCVCVWKRVYFDHVVYMCVCVCVWKREDVCESMCILSAWFIRHLSSLWVKIWAWTPLWKFGYFNHMASWYWKMCIFVAHDVCKHEYFDQRCVKVWVFWPHGVLILEQVCGRTRSIAHRWWWQICVVVCMHMWWYVCITIT